MTAVEHVPAVPEPVADDSSFEREIRLRLFRLERRVAAVERRLEQLEADAWFHRVTARRRRWWSR